MVLHNKMASQANVLFASFCSYLGALSFGFVIGYSSPALPKMQKVGQLMAGDDIAASWFGSIATIGGMLGCPIAGWIVEKYGRKTTLLITSLPFLLGWIGIAYGTTLQMLYTSRFLTGLGGGMVCVGSPLYISETSTKEMRGMLGSGVQLFVTIGILCVYIFGMYFDWRSLALLCAIIPVVSLITLRVPETPRYLLNSNQKSEALRSLLWLRGTSSSAEEECRDMEENTDVDEKVQWGEFLRPELYRPLTVAILIMMFQQMTGINVVMFYTVSIFQSAGYKENGEMATVIIGIVQVFGTIVACFLMDRSGRRKLLIFGGIGMAFACATMALYYHLQDEKNKSTSGTTNTILYSELSWLALASLIAYILAFALGWGPIPMLLTSEIFPVRARGSAIAIASLFNWLFAFFLTKEFSTIVVFIGMDGTFALFSAFCCIAVMYVWFFVPETKGKSLEDIGLYFLGRIIRGI